MTKYSIEPMVKPDDVFDMDIITICIKINLNNSVRSKFIIS